MTQDTQGAGGPKPGYRTIARSYEAQIVAGKLAVGDRLPTIREMTDTWGVSRGTCEKAVTYLKNRGWVTTNNRGGTRVSARVEFAIALEADSGPDPSLLTSVQVVSASLLNANEAAKELGVYPGTPVLVVRLATSRASLPE